MLSDKQKEFIRRILANTEAEHARITALEPDSSAAWYRLIRYAVCQIFRLGCKWQRADTWHLISWIAERKYRSLRRIRREQRIHRHP